jgi:hypothetical protein
MTLLMISLTLWLGFAGGWILSRAYAGEPVWHVRHDHYIKANGSTGVFIADGRLRMAGAAA